LDARNETSTSNAVTQQIDFSLIEVFTLATSNNTSVLEVTKCQSIDSIINCFEFLVQEFLVKILPAICIRFMVNVSGIALSDAQYHDFVEHLKNFKRSFLITFQSSIDNSCVVYWRLKDKFNIFELKIETNKFEVADFVRNLILQELLRNSNGKKLKKLKRILIKNSLLALHPSLNIPETRLSFEVSFDMLCDFRMYNLLFLAAEVGKSSIVKFLLKHFDVNAEVSQKIAADLAYEAQSYDTLLILLQANSRFPRNLINIGNLPVELRKFIVISRSMHEAISSGHEDEILDLLSENRNLKHFFDLNNNSAIAVSLRIEAFNIYKLLVIKNISLGQHESIDEVFQHLTESQRKQLSEINVENGQNLAPPHILKLLGNSIVGIDDDQVETRLVHVLRALQKLNAVDEIEILLKLTAAFKNFQLVFDFNRDHVQFLDPRAEAYVNGLFYFSGRIYIAAMHLLDKERAHEVSFYFEIN
jgi:hypothetical protein